MQSAKRNLHIQRVYIFLSSRLGTYLLLALVLLIGAYFRLVGINWDADQHLHPDERFMTIVAEQISSVDDLSTYFNPETSTLNPLDYGFYTYGMMPLFLTRYLAEGLSLTSYNDIVLVGRMLSAIFDLAAVFLLFLLGARLYDRWIGLLAAALYSAAVLPIQLSHFFAVDSFATVFILIAFYAADLIQEQPKNSRFLVFGVATGLALTTKISLAPLALIAPISALVYLSKIWPVSAQRHQGIRRTVVGLVLAGLYSALVFRIFQPYAFSGPGFFDIQLNSRWLEIISAVTDQVAGLADFPPSHHWAGRSWSYAWINLVRYGLGWSLGLTATLAWFWATWRLLRGQGGRHLLVVLWIGGYFLWQNSQFWRYNRYFLPIYPLAILLAAWLLLTILRKAKQLVLRSQRPSPWSRSLTLIITLMVIVLGSTYLYAYAFTRIYTRPHTRVSATAWLRQQVPGPLNIIIVTESGAQTIPLSYPYDLVLEPDDRWTINFVPPDDGQLLALSIPSLEKGIASSQSVDLAWQIVPFGANREPLVEKLSHVDFAQDENQVVTLEIPFIPAMLEAGQTYDLVLQVLDGSPISFGHQAIAVETSWDDALPLRSEGFDPYGGIYHQVDLALFEPDNEIKRERIVAGLSEAEWLVISSNRVYDAAPRIPHRFPLTLAYYQTLFNCDSGNITTCAYPAQPGLISGLGYELTAVFESYPTLGSLTFPDQEAMESFTVYDHPKVFIFRKRADFSPSTVVERLNAVELEEIIAQSAYQYTDAPDALRLPAGEGQILEKGVTWRDIFNVNGLLNRSPGAAVISWYLLLLLLGCMVFPLQLVLFPNLALHGYGLARFLALLLIGWLAWLAGSWQLLPFRWGTLMLALLLIGLISGFVSWRSRHLLIPFIRRNWRHLLLFEGLFALLFILGLIMRLNNPDLWHPFRGGEKPGELAMFNAVLKTAYFPPYEPWLAGFRMNYYYFGYVLAAVPTKLLGILPSFSFNLLLPTWFGMTGLAIFTAAFNLLGPPELNKTNATSDSPYRAAYQAGLVALSVGLLLGNLYQIRLFWQYLPNLALAPGGDSSFLGRLRDALSGLSQVIIGRADLFQGNTGQWYFDASRAILNGNQSAPITEFPFFTFLYGDLHPHLLDMPLVLTALVWMIGLLRVPGLLETRKTGSSFLRIGTIFMVGGLLIGATYPTNTWNFPVILTLGCAALAVAGWLHHSPNLKKAGWQIGWQVILLVLLAFGLYLPFRESFATGRVALQWWAGPRTPLLDYFTVHGLFLYIVISYLLLETARLLLQAGHRWKHLTLEEILSKWRNRFLLIAAFLLIVIVGINWAWNRDLQTALIAGFLTTWAFCLTIFGRLGWSNLVALILTIAGLGLTLLVEFVTLAGDVGRMNIVFKSYLVVWFLFSIAAAVLSKVLWSRLAGWNWRWLWLLGLEFLLIGALAYPLTAPMARWADRWPDMQNPPKGLNGLAYLTKRALYLENDQSFYLDDEYPALRWAQNNLAGAPTIVEAHTSEYRWGARFSSYTGLPTIVGWRWHLQQRNRVLPASVVDDRLKEIAEFYNTLDRTKALQFLDRYHVDYVIVGQLEKALYEEAGLVKFQQMALDGRLTIVYPTNGEPDLVTIYAVSTSR